MKLLLLSFALILAVSSMALSEPSLKADGNKSADQLKSKPASKDPKSDGPKPNRAVKKRPPQSEQHFSSTATDTKAPKQDSLSIKIIESDYLDKTAKQEEDYKKENLEVQRKLTNYTFGLVLVAVFQIILFLCQLYWFRETVAISRITANAAKDNAAAALEEAKAITLSERAYVFAKVDLIDNILPSHDGTTITNNRVLFVNHGKTPAIIRNMSGAPYLTPETPQQLSEHPSDDRNFSEGWVIAGGGGEFQLPIPLHITNQEMGEIERGAMKLCCAGLIKYKDILGNERETGYCWEYIHAQRRFKFCYASRLNHYT